MGDPETREKRSKALKKEYFEKIRAEELKGFRVSKRRGKIDPEDDYSNLDEWLMRGNDVT